MDASAPLTPDRLTIRLLGNFELRLGDRMVTPSAPKLRQILAVLALRCNDTVPVDLLIDELWGSRPPRSAVPALHTHVYELRRELHTASTARFVHTTAHGYLMEVRPQDIDVTVFDAQVAAGRAALANDDPAGARNHLSGALRLYRGRALADIRCGDVLGAQVTRLQESRLSALELRVEADFRSGRHHELVGELKSIVVDQPFHEGFYHKLMTALYRCGRRNEALEVYQQLRRRLVEELGIEPGPQVQRLQRALVSADPDLEPAPDRPRVALRVTGGPAQLPRDLTDLTGRAQLLDRLAARLVPRHDNGGTPILLITGMPGVGKTATAVHLAHAVRESFPDGQLYASLGGSTGSPQRAADVAGVFLRACGIADVPLDPAERTAALRTWSADRRALVVLDDADSADQVQALLPGGSACAVVLTSRFPLYAVPGVETVQLDVLDVADGLEMLGRVIGNHRIAAEPGPAADIVRAVGGLPLAIRLVGQRLAAFPQMRLGSCLRMLSEAIGRSSLSELSTIGPDLHSRLDASYRRLGAADRRAFRLLALLGTDEFTADDASKIFLVDRVTAELTLLRLADAHFVRGGGTVSAAVQRYTVHPLLRRFCLDCLMLDGIGEPVGVGTGTARN
jgi:DNA-binding SARP family transcriptional activator